MTQAQWAAVVTMHPAKFAYGLDPYPSFFKGDDLPVESIAWNQADEFCRRLAEMTSASYRLRKRSRMGIFLPRRIDQAVQRRTDDHNRSYELLRRGRKPVCGPEATARASHPTSMTALTYGSGAYDQGPAGIFRATTTPKGTFPPNRFGLHDMHGNVWDYCLDAANQTYADAPAVAERLSIEGKPRSNQILRGSSWSHNPAICRSAYRDVIAPDNPGWQG